MFGQKIVECVCQVSLSFCLSLSLQTIYSLSVYCSAYSTSGNCPPAINHTPSKPHNDTFLTQFKKLFPRLDTGSFLHKLFLFLFLVFACTQHTVFPPTDLRHVSKAEALFHFLFPLSEEKNKVCFMFYDYYDRNLGAGSCCCSTVFPAFDIHARGKFF